MNFLVECFAVFQKGGPVMYLILLCSLSVAAIGIERYLYYQAVKTDMAGFLDKLMPALERRDWEAASVICRQTGGIVTKVALQGLQCLQRDVYHIQSVLEGTAALEAARLREKLGHLDMIVTIAPLLGLLGTVIGMISSFSVMNVKAGQPLAITGGVGEALVATASGLCVAILALVVHSYFTQRLDGIITDLEEVCTLLIGQVKRGERP